MKRQIKFRAKRIDTQQWVYGWLVDTDKEFPAIISYDKKSLQYSRDLVAADTVCQYTGLNDCDGKEIYEGDIVKSTYYSYDNSRDEAMHRPLWSDSCTDLIGFHKEYCAFMVKNLKDNSIEFFPATLLVSSNIEILGNKYDNPELIKKKRQ